MTWGTKNSQRCHILTSDLIPLSFFSIYAITQHNPPPLWGPIISRLSSLIYHAFEATHPSLLSLDHLGICSMAMSVPAACAMAEDGWGVHACGPFNAAVVVVFGCVVVEIVVVHGVAKRALLFRNPEHALLSLALIGNAPVLAIIANPSHPPSTRLLFAFSLLAFGVGYFVLKPNHHVLWHWAAAVAQAAGVAAIGV